MNSKGGLGLTSCNKGLSLWICVRSVRSVGAVGAVWRASAYTLYRLNPQMSPAHRVEVSLSDLGDTCKIIVRV